MQVFKRAEIQFFEKTLQLQKGKISSRWMLIVYQTFKLLLKDLCSLLLFLLAIPAFKDFIATLLDYTLIGNEICTRLITVSLILFVAINIIPIKKIRSTLNAFNHLVVPILDIFSLFIIIIFINYFYANVQSDLLLAFSNIISIIILFLIQTSFSLFNFTKAPTSKNLLSKRQAPLVSMSDICLNIFSIGISFRFFSANIISNIQLMAYSLIFLLLTSIQIKQRLSLKYYVDSFANEISIISYLIVVSIAFLTFVMNIMASEPITNNYILITIIMTTFSYSAIRMYRQNRTYNMILSTTSNLKTEEEAIIYMDCLSELIKKVELDDGPNYILVSLKKQHILTCKTPTCFCQEPKQLGDFIREYVKYEVQIIAKMFKKSLSILQSLLFFKFVIFEDYIQILAKNKYYSIHFDMSRNQRFNYHSLNKSTIEFINHKNSELKIVEVEAIFKLEDIRTETEAIITKDIYIRGKKWKYLSRGHCNFKQLQLMCNLELTSISRMMEISRLYSTLFKKNKDFNLLLLFYFTRISFLNNGSTIKENLKEIYGGYNEDQLFSIQAFKKNIFHKNSCAIESQVNLNSASLISSVSKNTEEIFGISTSKAIGLNINSLMPKFMTEQHKVVVQKWLKVGTWNVIGNLKQVYCLHSEGHCFSALIYIKIYVKNNSAFIITNVFKLNDNDIMLINKNMKIQGLGKKMQKLLGQSAQKISLSAITDPSKLGFAKSNNLETKKHRMVLFSLKDQCEEVEALLENLNGQTEEHERLNLNSEFYNYLKQSSTDKYLMEFQRTTNNMADLTFYVLTLKECRKIQGTDSNDFTKKQFNQTKDELFQQQGQEDKSQSNEDDKDFIFQNNMNSSMASVSEKQNFPLSKIIQKFIAIFQKPSLIDDSRLKIFNFILLTFFILLAATSFASYYYYKESFLGIQAIIIADGAANDITEGTQVLYQQLFILKTELLAGLNSNFDSTMQTAKYIRQYVYDLLHFDSHNLISAVTLSQQRLYQFLQTPANWIMGSKTVSIETYQFVANIGHAMNEIFYNLQDLRKTNSTNINYAPWVSLYQNFPQLIKLNSGFLDLYQNKSFKSHTLLGYIIKISIIFYLLVSFILALLINRYFKFRFYQKINSFNFFRYVSAEYLDRMKDYYQQLSTSIIDTNCLKKIDEKEDKVFQYDTHELFHHEKGQMSNVSSKIMFINYQNYYKWILIFFVFIGVNFLGYFASTYVLNFIQQSNYIVEQITEMIQQQNRLIQSLIQLKAEFYFHQNMTNQQDSLTNLINFNNQNQITFNALSKATSNIYNGFDPTFRPNFSNLLLNDICSLMEGYIPEQQIVKCQTQFRLNLLNNGILVSCGYYQRMLRLAIEDFIDMYIEKSKQPYEGDYFLQPKFLEVDRMMFPMFKIFQQLQDEVFTTYITTINVITQTYLEITISIIAFFIVLMFFWFRNIKYQKQEIAQLYGHLLLIPFMILKTNLRIVNSLKEVIEYEEN